VRGGGGRESDGTSGWTVARERRASEEAIAGDRGLRHVVYAYVVAVVAAVVITLVGLHEGWW
jgi:hypothetical protein